AQLQDHRPDIILLDIEMPRMDGFEVASFVRHDENLKDTPICMITSRTGEKHRERALAIGVNEYLGKPFQESELLETIKRLTGTQRCPASPAGPGSELFPMRYCNATDCRKQPESSAFRSVSREIRPG